MFVCMDFEARCKLDIKQVGGHKWTKHAQPLCLAYSLDGGETYHLWRLNDLPPYDLFEAIKSGAPIHAHNAMFELMMWENCMVPKHNWPAIDRSQWRCTMAECYAAGLAGSLSKAGQQLDLDVVKDKVGSRVMLKLAKPRKPTRWDERTWHYEEKDRKILYAYCIKDVAAELAIHNTIPRLRTDEQSIWKYDVEVNLRGIPIDIQFVQAAVEIWGRHCDDLTEELQEVSGGAIESVDAVKEMKRFLAEKCGLKMDSVKKEAVDKVLKTLPEGPARRVLELRQEMGLSSIAKYQKMLYTVEEDHRIRGCLQYHGAGTGRWAGRLIQIQNFPRGKIKAETGEKHAVLVEELITKVRKCDRASLYNDYGMSLGDILSGLLRSAIKAPPGKRLMFIDFAAIEARALAWAAQEKWLIDEFSGAGKVYEEMASRIFRKPISEITKDSQERFYGKTAVLGCGYQLGGPTFYKHLTENFGITDVTKDFAQTVVDMYRESCPRIKSLWYGLQRAAMNAIKNPTKAYQRGPFRFFMKDRWLCLQLPVGRCIRYLDPQIQEGKYGEQITYMNTDWKGQVTRISTYGGKLTENAIQGLCRDILVHSLVKLEEAGYPVIAHVHDEVIMEVDENFGSLKEAEDIMRDVPSWCKGLPIDVEGNEGVRYRK